MEWVAANDDELGVYFGPIRWVSHAIEERGVTDEKQAIEQELKRRPQNVALQQQLLSLGADSGGIEVIYD